MESAEARYKTLIQPIRDLAANWDIDIAESLTEYLDDLEGLRVSFDGKNELNFAEAALLIQGSTAIYSRKVEYLYQLVLKSLEFMHRKKGGATGSKGNSTDQSSNVGCTAGGNSANNRSRNGRTDITIWDDESILQLGNVQDASMLLLDDLVETGVNIDLNTSVLEMSRRQSLLGLSKDMSVLSAGSGGNMETARRMPFSSMNSIFVNDAGNAGLKLTSGYVDSTGALQLGAGMTGTGMETAGGFPGLVNGFPGFGVVATDPAAAASDLLFSDLNDRWKETNEMGRFGGTVDPFTAGIVEFPVQQRKEEGVLCKDIEAALDHPRGRDIDVAAVHRAASVEEGAAAAVQRAGRGQQENGWEGEREAYMADDYGDDGDAGGDDDWPVEPVSSSSAPALADSNPLLTAGVALRVHQEDLQATGTAAAERPQSDVRAGPASAETATAAVGRGLVVNKQPFIDPFMMMDPHIVVGGSREVRPGKPYRIPKSPLLATNYPVQKQVKNGNNRPNWIASMKSRARRPSSGAILSAHSAAEYAALDQFLNLGAVFGAKSAVSHTAAAKVGKYGKCKIGGGGGSGILFSSSLLSTYKLRKKILQRVQIRAQKLSLHRETYGTCDAAGATQAERGEGQQHQQHQVGDGSSGGKGAWEMEALEVFNRSQGGSAELLDTELATHIPLTHTSSGHALAAAGTQGDIGGEGGGYDDIGEDNDDGGGFYLDYEENPVPNDPDPAVPGTGTETGVQQQQDLSKRTALEQELAEEEELARRVEQVLNDELSFRFSSGYALTADPATGAGANADGVDGERIGAGAEGVRNSYEMICRRHIHKFTQGVENYVRESQLSKRVSEWTLRLEPLLRTQELTPSYDIHRYADRILSDITHVIHSRPPSLLMLEGMQWVGERADVGERESEGERRERETEKDIANVVGFTELVQGCPSSEVCRVFLACLQLANLGNLTVIPPIRSVPTSSPTASARYSLGKDRHNRQNNDNNNYRRDAGKAIDGNQVPKVFHLRLNSANRNQDIHNFLAPSVAATNAAAAAAEPIAVHVESTAPLSFSTVEKGDNIGGNAWKSVSFSPVSLQHKQQQKQQRNQPQEEQQQPQLKQRQQQRGRRTSSAVERVSNMLAASADFHGENEEVEEEEREGEIHDYLDNLSERLSQSTENQPPPAAAAGLEGLAEEQEESVGWREEREPAKAKKRQALREKNGPAAPAPTAAMDTEDDNKDNEQQQGCRGRKSGRNVPNKDIFMAAAGKENQLSLPESLA